jgi:hypothetical protein
MGDDDILGGRLEADANRQQVCLEEYSGRKNMWTIRLFIHIVHISHDENRD